jgi:hypothetical protein
MSLREILAEFGVAIKNIYRVEAFDKHSYTLALSLEIINPRHLPKDMQKLVSPRKTCPAYEDWIMQVLMNRREDIHTILIGDERGKDAEFIIRMGNHGILEYSVKEWSGELIPIS